MTLMSPISGTNNLCFFQDWQLRSTQATMRTRSCWRSESRAWRLQLTSRSV